MSSMASEAPNVSDRGVITGRWSQLIYNKGGGRIAPDDMCARLLSRLRRALAVFRQAWLLVDLCRHTIGVWRSRACVWINRFSPSTV